VTGIDAEVAAIKVGSVLVEGGGGDAGFEAGFCNSTVHLSALQRPSKGAVEA